MSNMYNMMNGVNPATFMILPMLGKHPEEYPRFRDCFTGDSAKPEYDNHIILLTRTGGPNRDSFELENQTMERMPEFVDSYDAVTDHSFAHWVFKVPEKWQADYDHLMAGESDLISDAYVQQLKTVFPKLADQFTEAFGARGDG